MKKSKLKRVLSLVLATVMVAGISAFAPQGAAEVQAAATVKNTIIKITDIEGLYEIASAEDLLGFASYVNNGNINVDACLTADIDMTGKTWTLISAYSGTFDGKGKTISGLNNHLFNQLSGTVKNLIITGSSAAVEAWNEVGGNGMIAGWNKGTIEKVIVDNCSLSYGAWSYLGGIAGRNMQDGVIRDCAVTNTLLQRRFGGASSTGGKPIGGIVEANEGRVENCYTYACTFTNGMTKGGIIANGTAPINSYYGAAAGVNSNEGGTEASEEEFSSGKIAYLLNNGKTDGTQAWYQTAGSGIPHLNGTTTETIYKGYDSCLNTEPLYANKPLSEVIPAHKCADWTENSDGTYSCTCTVCNAVETLEIPTADSLIYNPEKTLRDVTITPGANSVEGSWSWETPSTVPTCNNKGYTLVFTPTDSDNYKSRIYSEAYLKA